MTLCRHTWVRFSSLCKGADKVSVIVPPDLKAYESMSLMLA